MCGLRLQPLVDALKAEVLDKAVLHADETPVQMLKPGAGKAHKAYLWAYTPTSYDSLRAVVYDFTPSRAGGHCRTFLDDWRGKLVTDDYVGYKAGFAAGITELGCMAHARRKFHDLHAKTTGTPRSTTIGSRTRSVPGRSGVQTGCSLGRCAVGSVQPAIMSLIQSARLNGHDPYAYLKDVLTRLPTHKNHRIAELLPHRWTPAT